MSGMNAAMGRIRMMLARVVVALVDDAATVQLLQVDGLADETLDEVERFGSYGFTSAPHPGAEGVLACVGGLRSHGIVIAIEDRRYRLTGLKAGEVALYDDLGQRVLLGRDGIVVQSDRPILVKTPHATIDADRVDLGGTGGKAVARVGDAVANGVITAGSSKVFSS